MMLSGSNGELALEGYFPLIWGFSNITLAAKRKGGVIHLLLVYGEVSVVVIQ